ncbi:hypothetical protein QUC31_009576, partial [Theobroma cacao]
IAYCDVRLSDTSELMKIWSRNPQEILTFKYLEKLEVDDCSTLRFLFTLSMALGLPQLRELIVKNCIVMEHIITEEESDEQVANETVFPLLRSITLEYCENLASFYQGSKSLEYPSLEKVVVSDCPKMFTFASAFSREQRIEIIDEGNTTRLSKGIADIVFLDNTIAYCDVRLSDTSELMKIWSRNPQEILTFKYLEKLEVDDCSTLRFLFTLSMALGLPQLRELIVENCIVMEHIITEEESDEQVANKTVFLQLRSVTLRNCENLASFYQGSKSLEYPSLEKVVVSDCPKMFTFASAFSREQRIEIIDEGNTTRLSKGIADIVFLDNTVGYSNLRLSDTSELMKIWSGNPQEILPFKYLEFLEVHDCSSLRWLFTHSTALSLPRLRTLKVKNCIVMEHIIKEEGPDEQVASFYQGNKILEFPSLEELEVVGCPQMFAFAFAFSREQRIETIDDIDGGNTTRVFKGIVDTVFFDNTVSIFYFWFF